MTDLEKYKLEQARARDLGLDYAAIRSIILSVHAEDDSGISEGRAIELIREMALKAVDKAVTEERASVLKFLGEAKDSSETPYGYDDLKYVIAIISCGAHRKGEGSP